MRKKIHGENAYTSLILYIKGNIRKSRYLAMRSANRELVLLYYHIGKSLFERVQSEEWGSKILERISTDIQHEFPGIRGFSIRNLVKMRQFFLEYNYLDETLTSTTSKDGHSSVRIGENGFTPPVVAQLGETGKSGLDSEPQGAHENVKMAPHFPSVSLNEFVRVFLNIGFSHHIILLNKCHNIGERYYYISEAVRCQWSRRVLEYHIESNHYRRKGKLSNNFQQCLSDDIKEHAIEAFKDEYLLDFISTDDARSEQRMEKGIISKLKRFMMSLGSEFTFMGNQYRLVVGGDEFFIDLLFFHRKLRCMVVFELKTDKFRPEYAGKINFYLSALDTIVKHPDENPSIGIVLCKEKNATVVEFAFQDMKKPMGVATFRHGDALPKHMRKYLPTPEDLENALS